MMCLQVLLFLVPLQYDAGSPPAVSQALCTASPDCSPLVHADHAAASAYRHKLVSPLIRPSAGLLECKLTAGRTCSLMRELSGIGAVGLLTQFLSVRLFSRYAVKKIQ